MVISTMKLCTAEHGIKMTYGATRNYATTSLESFVSRLIHSTNEPQLIISKIGYTAITSYPANVVDALFIARQKREDDPLPQPCHSV